MGLALYVSLDELTSLVKQQINEKQCLCLCLRDFGKDGNIYMW